MIQARLSELDAASAPRTGIRFPSLFQRPWLWPHLLSLDAVFVALLWQQLFAAAVNVVLSPVERAALGLAVWIIYTADRALDASARNVLPTARHVFYKRCRTAALVCCASAVCAEAVCCSELGPHVLLGGIVLVAVVVLYFLGVHAPHSKIRHLPKELKVAVLFGVGTVLVPAVKSGFDRSLLLPVLLFTLLCLLNCACVEYREWQRFRPFRTPAPVPAGRLARNLQPIAWCAFLCAGVALVFFASGHELYGSIALASLALLGFHRTQHRMSADLMRVAVDLPLMLPILLILAKFP